MSESIQHVYGEFHLASTRCMVDSDFVDRVNALMWHSDVDVQVDNAKTVFESIGKLTIRSLPTGGRMLMDSLQENLSTT